VIRSGSGSLLRRLGVVAGLGTMAFLLAGPSAALAAEDELGRTPWQMYISPTPHGKLSNGYVGKNNHGAVEYYHDANPPAVGDPGWQPAPNPDYIGFDGTVDPKFGGRNASRLPKTACFQQVDYTYFQTVVTVPPGVKVDTFTVNFNVIDDGARISVYNSRHLDGQINENSYVKLNQAKSHDLAAELVPGDNRIVITQLDDCAVGNNLGKADIVMNGTKVIVDEPVPTTEPSAAASETTAPAPTASSAAPAASAAPVASVAPSASAVALTPKASSSNWTWILPIGVTTIAGVAWVTYRVTVNKNGKQTVEYMTKKRNP
jgi:hypothetical protein